MIYTRSWKMRRSKASSPYSTELLATEKDTIKSYVNVYKALMEYSLTLLEGYHEALQKELAEHGIDI